MTFQKKRKAGAHGSLQQKFERELVEQMCFHIRKGALVTTGLGTFVGVYNGDDMAHTFTPAIIFASTLLGSILMKDPVHQVTLFLYVLVFAVSQNAVFQEGCSASVVPHLAFGATVCFSALLYRTARAVILTTCGVLASLCVIYASDLAGFCPSDPIHPDDKSSIVVHRLIPGTACIVVTCVLMVVVIDQSQRSIRLNAEAAEAAENLAKLRHNILHRVTHELRTPLHGIVGSVELLMSSKQLTREDRENTETIQQCLKSIVGICDNVLLAANSTSSNSPGATNSSKNTAKNSIFSLSRVVDDVVETYSHSAQAKGIELRADFMADSECMLRGMENQLLQVLRNLVNNAIKFTDSGFVALKVKTTECGSGQSALMCRFEVQDTGQGIDTSQQGLLFQPFHQAEGNAISRHHKGAGLGLSIVRELVQTMGGSIEVESEVAKGSKFYFDLVLRKAIMAEPRSLEMESDTEGEIVILDSQTESRNCCLSVAETVAAAPVQIHIFDDHTKLLRHAADMEKDTRQSRIAVLECLVADGPFQYLVKAIQSAGWLVLAYCDQEIYNELVELKLCSTVFSRPFSLARMGDALSGALAGPRNYCDLDEPLDKIPQVFHSENGSAEIVPPIIGMSLVNSPKERSKSLTKQDLARKSISLSPPKPSTKMPDPSSGKAPDFTNEFEDLDLPPGCQVVVVDDTPINVKVLTRILSRLVSVPIVSLYSGQAAIDFVQNSDLSGPIFFLMDWHMPSVCGLTASRAIRDLCESKGLCTFISIITADIEGLYAEMKQRDISYHGTVSRGTLTMQEDDTTDHSTNTANTSQRDQDSSDQSCLSLQDSSASPTSDNGLVIDLVSGKPVTIQSIQTILTYFHTEWKKSNDLAS